MQTRGSDELIRSLYEAAATPERLPSALAAVGRSLHASAALFGQVDLATGARLFEFRSNISEEGTGLCTRRHLRNPITAAAIQAPIMSAYTSEAVIAPEARTHFVQSEFWKRVLGPEGLHRFIGGVLRFDSEAFSSISFYRSDARGPFDESERHQLTLLLPHFAGVEQIRLRLSEVDMHRAAAFDTLDLIAAPVLLFDTSQRFMFANRGARTLLARGAGLRLRREGLCAGADHATADLRRAIAGATAIANARDIDPGCGQFAIPRPPPDGPLLATAVPLRGHALTMGTQTAAVALFLSDPEAIIRIHDGALRAVYGLTAAEARVANLVAKGKGLASIARQLRVSVNTVRTHLARALDKTGTRGQTELAAAVTRLAAQYPQAS